MQKEGSLGELLYLNENIVLHFVYSFKNSDLFKMASNQLVKLVTRTNFFSAIGRRE